MDRLVFVLGNTPVQSVPYATFAQAAATAWDYAGSGYRVSVGRAPGDGWRVTFLN